LEERWSKVNIKAVVVFETMALAENSVLLWYEAVYLGVWFPTLRANMAASSSKSKCSTFRHPECEATTLSRNAWNRLPIDATSYARKIELSMISLLKLWNSAALSTQTHDITT